MISLRASRAVGVAARPAAALVHTSARRSSSHDDAHHSTAGDDANTAPETLLTPFWRNTLIVSTIAYALYAYVPSEDALKQTTGPITRFIQNRMTPVDEWAAVNERHTMLSAYTAEGKIIAQEAVRPPIHRYRFPGLLDQASPHLSRVGSDVDVGHVDVKREGA